MSVWCKSYNLYLKILGKILKYITALYIWHNIILLICLLDDKMDKKYIKHNGYFKLLNLLMSI